MAKHRSTGHGVAGTGSREARVEELLPFISKFADRSWRDACIKIWIQFWAQSEWQRLEDVPALLEVPELSLVSHVRATWAASEALAKVAATECEVHADMEVLRAVCALHDVSKLVEYRPSELGPVLSSTGTTYPHAVLAGMAAAEAKFPEKVVNIVLEHPYHPPHVHVTPKSIERILFHYADTTAVDVVLFKKSRGTHLEFRRFFSVP